MQRSSVRQLALLVALACGSGSAVAQVPSPPPPPACTASEHRQFDFWVGYWDVYRTGKDDIVAHSLIEKLYDGCAIRENWLPHRGGAGGSLNSYFPDERLWRQIWVDAANGWGVFEGTFQNGAMVLSGTWKNINGPGTQEFTRTTWSRNSDGSVRQFGEIRSKNRKTWTPGFDFTYRKSASAPPK
jgi:hypothetical protein